MYDMSCVGLLVEPVPHMSGAAVLYLRALAALAMPLTVDAVVPAALLSRPTGSFDAGGAGTTVGVLLAAAGSVILLDSVLVRFAREGRGTLAPVDPPRFVVRGGLYRVVRNPMYIANIAILVGVGVAGGSWLVLAWAGVMAAAFHGFVVWYEEPTLRRRFADDYADYCRLVGRWLPHTGSSR